MSHPDAIAILSALPMPAILIDGDGRITGANAGAEGMFGTALTQRHHVTILRQPALIKTIEDTARDGTRRISRYLNASQQGDTTWRAVVSAVPAPSDIAQILVIFEDITAQTQASQARREFVSNVSHELRTPLTAVLGFVETLRGAARDDPAARDRFLGVIEDEARRMADLVQDLASLSHVEEQGRQRPQGSVNLSTLIADVLASLSPVLDAAGVTIRTALPAGDITVPGEATQLKQVVINLVENAAKYGAAQGEITLRLTPAAPDPQLIVPAVCLSVTDHGDGIPAHAIARLTDRFYRLDSHRSREVGGTGLGLAIVKHILNRHHGRLQIDSVQGQGSTFSAILPAA